MINFWKRKFRIFFCHVPSGAMKVMLNFFLKLVLLRKDIFDSLQWIRRFIGLRESPNHFVACTMRFNEAEGTETGFVMIFQNFEISAIFVCGCELPDMRVI